MSEFEILRRQEYKRNRKKWSLIQIIAIALCAVIMLGSFITYHLMNRTYYIEYTENGKIDYKVQYIENDFYDGDWLESNSAYISALVKNIAADFDYTLNMDTDDVGFDYSYFIDAKLVIANEDSGNAYYTVTEQILPKLNVSTIKTDTISISESVDIDYVRFNTIAKEFIKTYNLSDASATLIVTLNVDVISTSERFAKSGNNTYSTSLNIPMAEETFNIEVTASAPNAESKVLAHSGGVNKNLFLIIAIVFAVLTALLVLTLITFLHLTKNDDITYIARVRKILSAYRSFIQRMDGEFDDNGYQTVIIKSFVEMLAIRDTIQSPILMTENSDETKTRFLIPTNTKLLYVFEIKVDNYDEIYGKNDEDEAIILEDNVDIDEVTEALNQPDVILSDIEYEDNDDDEFEVAEDEPGVEVIGVVWPEKAHKNKVYRYDPNGEELHEGDLVLVPTRDNAKNKEVIRKAAVAHGNHRVDPEHIKHPLKKIIGVIKRKTEAILTSSVDDEK